MRALVLGSTGFIGQNLCLYLASIGIDFDVLNRDWNWKPVRQEYDLVFFLAGEVRKVEDMYSVHVKLLYRVLAESLKWDCLFIYLGSSSEYGRINEPATEKNIINPTNLYDATKGVGTLLCQGFARQFNKPIIIIRPSSVYGKYERPDKFIPTIIRKITNNEQPNVHKGMHDWIHVDDLISAIFHAILFGNHDGEIYNVSSGKDYDNLDIAMCINRFLCKNKGINYLTSHYHKHDTDYWVIDNSKIKALGWKPKYDLYHGLEKTVKEISERMRS
jgi:nucleoside-diphosphate-sugar epimerase